MTSKTISLSGDAYKTLAREKMEGESFSKVVMRLTASRGKLSSYAGAWNGELSDKGIQEMKAGIEEMRKSATDCLLK
jgi:predicted CopG family antitoxin